MKSLKHFLLRMLGTRSSSINFSGGSATNKWGASLPEIPAGRLFDERVLVNMNRRIDEVLAEGHLEN